MEKAFDTHFEFLTSTSLYRPGDPDVAHLGAHPVPSPQAVHNAVGMLRHLANLITEHTGWVQPHITTSESGEIVCEWWSGGRKLTIYVGEHGSESIKVWGPDIENQMELSEIRHSQDLIDTWFWLHAI